MEMKNNHKDEGVDEANERFQKWKDETKQPTCSNGYVFALMGHDYHITEVGAIAAVAMAAIMLILLLLGTDIKSSVFAAMTFVFSLLGLVLFWNHAKVNSLREQADQMEQLCADFSQNLDTLIDENKELKSSVDTLNKTNDEIKASITSQKKSLGMLDENGNEIQGVLEGYQNFLNSQDQLSKFHRFEAKIKEDLLNMQSESVLKQQLLNKKNSLRIEFRGHQFRGNIDLTKDEKGEYKNEAVQDFVATIKDKFPELDFDLEEGIESLDTNNDNQLSQWEFLIQTDKCADKWAEGERLKNQQEMKRQRRLTVETKSAEAKSEK